MNFINDKIVINRLRKKFKKYIQDFFDNEIIDENDIVNDTIEVLLNNIEYDDLLDRVTDMKDSCKKYNLQEFIKKEVEVLFEPCMDREYYDLKFTNHWNLDCDDINKKRCFNSSPGFIRGVSFTDYDNKIIIGINFYDCSTYYYGELRMGKDIGEITLIPEDYERKKSLAFIYFALCCRIIECKMNDKIKNYWKKFPVELL